MSNALYYTFSTIAQTLAGAMALLAAFLLYRLQTLNQSIEKDAERISIALAPYHGRAHEMLRGREYNELLKAAEYIPQGQARPEAESARLSTLLRTKQNLLRRFKIALYLTASLITLSIAVLVATPYLSTFQLAVYTVFASGLIGFVACIVSYISVLRAAFD